MAQLLRQQQDFTSQKNCFGKIRNKGISIAKVTLHVGIGTFRPVKTENVEEHEMHSEHFYIKKEDAEKINNAKANRKKSDFSWNNIM